MAGASTSQALSGMAAGATIGSVVPGWGTAIGAVVGLLAGMMGGDGGAAQQQQLARDQLQQQDNQQEYQKNLNSIALQRSIAGSKDSYGSEVKYDPGSNTWTSALGEMPKRIQDAENSSTLLRNAVDIPQSTANNVAQSVLASENRRGLSGAINNYQSYVPTSEAGLRGALQDASTRANSSAQEPLIQDTLRQFARTGTSAAPVLARMGRENSLALSQEMDQNVINAAKGAADIDSSRRQSLAQPLAAMSSLGSPNMSYAPLTGSNPAAQIAALVNGRAQGSATPANQAAATAAYGASGMNAAYANAIAAAGNDPTVAKWGSMGRQVGDLVNGVTGKDSTGTSIWSSLFGGSGNNADQKPSNIYSNPEIWGS